MVKKKLIFLLVVFFVGIVSGLSLDVVSPIGDYTNDTDIDVEYVVDVNVSSCWYSNDSMSVNWTLDGCVNITDVVWEDGWHNVTIWVNDTFGNESSDSVGFGVDTASPYFVNFENQSVCDNGSFGYDISAEDIGVGVDCFFVNDTNFSVTCDGVLTNATELLVGEYYVNVSVNDSLGNFGGLVLSVSVSSCVVEKYCGDGSCDGDEDCAGCSEDCGECPDDGEDDENEGDGGGSGGSWNVPMYVRENDSDDGNYSEENVSVDVISDSEIFVEEEAGGFRSFVTGLGILDFGGAGGMFSPAIVVITFVMVLVLLMMRFGGGGNVPGKRFNYDRYVKMIVGEEPEIAKDYIKGGVSREDKGDEKSKVSLPKKKLVSKKKFVFVLIGLFIFVVVAGVFVWKVQPSITGEAIGGVSFTIARDSFREYIDFTANVSKVVNTTDNFVVDFTFSLDLRTLLEVFEFTNNPTSTSEGLPEKKFNFIIAGIEENTSSLFKRGILKIYYEDDYIKKYGIRESGLRMYHFGEEENWTIIEESGVNIKENYVFSKVSSFSGFCIGESDKGIPPKEEVKEYFSGGAGCVYSWVCSNWSECVDGVETRECVNNGTCSDSFRKPEEARRCIPRYLMDIEFELEDNVVFDSDELTAWIMFTNFGTEPTSVYLTYVILDESGNEVYRENDSVVVEVEEVLRKSFEGLGLDEGKYTFVLNTLYGVDVGDEFRQEFEIRGSVGITGRVVEKLKSKSFVYGLIVLIVLVILVLVLRKKMRKRRLGKEKDVVSYNRSPE